MKVNKLTLDALRNEKCLSKQQMSTFVGGYDYTSDSSCLFNCMEYIGKELYGYEDKNCDYYGSAYVNGNGDYSGSGNWGDYLNGPELYGSGGQINGNIASFINSCFGAVASGFSTGDDAADLFKDGSNTGVIGIFETGSGTAHAVILTGYDSKTGTYSYYDPSKSSQGSNQTFSADDLCGAIDCKQ